MVKFCKWTRVLTGLALGLWVLQGTVLAEVEPNPEKIRDIHKLLEVSGLLEQMDYNKDRVLPPLSRMVSISYPKTPDEFWHEFNALIGTEETNRLMDRVVLVYNKHVSHEAVKQLIEMFSTPFWEEWKQKMPLISREAGLEATQWAQELLQSESLKKKIDALIQKYDLEKLNPPEKNELQDKGSP